MSRLDELVAHHPIPTMRPLAWVIMFVLGIGTIWAFLTHLEEVATATGEVIPQGQVKVVQHLEGGVIRDIHIDDGSKVKEGDPLLQITLSATAVNREELQVRLDGLILKLARLDAEARNKPLAFPPDVGSRRPEFVRTETDAHEARKNELDSALSSHRQIGKQRELEIKELESKITTLSADLKLAKKNFQISKDLLEQKLTSQVDHLKLERELGALDGEIKGTKVAQDKARASQAEAREREREETFKFRRIAQDEYNTTEKTLASTKELLEKATETASRTTIRAPIDGIVKNLKHHTIGGVVQAGEPIMEIVPVGAKVLIRAKLNPIDRGYVEEGQEAKVKVSTYDFARYGALLGKVIQIAPDANVDEKGIPFFRVIVETEKTYLGKVEGELPITPGMQATVDIKTGSKSVVDYLLRPVLKLQHEGFRER